MRGRAVECKRQHPWVHISRRREGVAYEGAEREEEQGAPQIELEMLLYKRNLCEISVR